MSASLLTRVTARGGYGAMMRASTRWGAPRSFSVAARFQEKKYAKSHEWIEYSADKKTATVGVSTYAAQSLGDIVYVELPAEGTEVGATEVLGAVESVKSASDLYSPITGTVTEANTALESKPALINQDAEGGAWIAKFDVTGEEAEGLMNAEEYKAFAEEESSDH